MGGGSAHKCLSHHGLLAFFQNYFYWSNFQSVGTTKLRSSNISQSFCYKLQRDFSRYGSDSI